MPSGYQLKRGFGRIALVGVLVALVGVAGAGGAACWFLLTTPPKPAEYDADIETRAMEGWSAEERSAMLADGFNVDADRGVLIRKGRIAEAWDEEAMWQSQHIVDSLLVGALAVGMGVLWFITWRTIGWIAAGFTKD